MQIRALQRGEPLFPKDGGTTAFALRPPGGLSVGSLSAKLIVCLFPALEVAAQMGPTLVVWNVQMLRLVPAHRVHS